MMGQHMKDIFKKVLFQAKDFLSMKNKITHMKVISKMDKSMVKVSKKHELKVMKVLNFVNQVILCSDWDQAMVFLMYFIREIQNKLTKDMKGSFIQINQMVKESWIFMKMEM